MRFLITVIWGEQIELLENHSDLPPVQIDIVLFIGNIHALEKDSTLRRLFKQIKAAQERAFARTRGTYHKYYLSAAYFR